MATVTAAETFDSFKEVHCDLDYVHSKIQFSMDGPYNILFVYVTKGQLHDIYVTI